ncbi:lambda family phage tail tape measure protein [Labrenzia sp. EL_195]|nr:lambda family phage tail tape measure protein [Labrenzia sp. EL_195]
MTERRISVVIDATQAESGAKRVKSALNGLKTSGNNAGTGLKKAEEGLKRVGSEAKRTTVTVRGVSNELGRSGQAMSGSFGGIAAQFQDIGVSIAGGMRPGLVALQQGTQIAGQMEMALRGGASAGAVLRSAFASLVSPVSLLSIGVTAIAGIGLQYIFSSWASEAEEASDALKQVADHMNRIRELGYDLAEFDPEQGFSAGLKSSIVAERIKVIQAEAEAARSEIANVFGDLVGGFRIADFGQTNLAAIKEELDAVGASGQWAVDRLQGLAEAAAAGEISAETFSRDAGTLLDAITKKAPEAEAAVETLRSGLTNAVENLVELQGNAEIASAAFAEMQRKIADKEYLRSARAAARDYFQQLISEAVTANQSVDEIYESLQNVQGNWVASLTIDIATTGIDPNNLGIQLGGSENSTLFDFASGQNRAQYSGGTYQVGSMPDAAGGLDFNPAKATGKRGGGGGGGSMRQQISELQQMNQQIQQMVAPTQQLSAVYRSLQQAMDMGVISSSEMNASWTEALAAFERTGGSVDQAKLAIEGLNTKTNEFGEGLAQVVESGLNSFGNALGTLVTGGQVDFKAMIDSMVKDLVKLMWQLLIVKPLMNMLTGGLGGGLGGLGGLGAGMYADGGAFSGGREIQAFANGGVVNKATMFPMSGGKTGLMGEAGPEAIMPLTRGANGKLGVQAAGMNESGQSGGNVYQFDTVVNVESNGESGQEIGDEIGNAMEAKFKLLVDTRIFEATRPGGVLQGAATG